METNTGGNSNAIYWQLNPISPFADGIRPKNYSPWRIYPRPRRDTDRGKGTHLEESPDSLVPMNLSLIAESDFDRLNNNGAYFSRLKRKFWGIFIVCLCVYFFFFCFSFCLWKEWFFGKVGFFARFIQRRERSIFKKATISLFIFLKKNFN